MQENDEHENGIILCILFLNCFIVFYLYEFMMEKEDAQHRHSIWDVPFSFSFFWVILNKSNIPIL